MLTLLRGALAGTAAVLTLCGFTFQDRPDQPLKGRVCYSRQEGTEYVLHVMDADGKNDRLLPRQPGKVNWMPDWSPDGKQIAFVSGPSAAGTDFGLYLMNAHGTNVRRLADRESSVSSPAWSPDGKGLLCTVIQGTTPRLLWVGMEESDLAEIRLGTGLRPLMTPFFSPDGRFIAVTATAKEGDPVASQIYSANPDGTEAQKVTSGPGPSFGSPRAWSPDGRLIAFVSLDTPGKPSHLHTWSIQAKEETHLIELKVPAGLPPELARPSWSPDGRWVVVSHLGTTKQPSLWRISTDGRLVNRLATPGDAAALCPAWTRD